MELNIADLFESVVDVVPDREAVVSGGTRLTYRQLDERANRLAHYLQASGVGPGDHVGMHLYNGNEFLEAVLATFKIRAVPVNINYRYVEDELRYLFKDSDLVALVHQREFAPLIQAVASDVPSLKTLICLDDESDEDCSALGSQPYETVLESGSPDRDFEPRSGEDLYIIYTGGTTGMPKGVMWRHQDVFYAGLQGGNPGGEPISKPEELPELVKTNPMPLTFFPAAPFIHGAAQWAALIGFFGGGKVVLLPGRSFHAPTAAKLIAAEGVQTITLVGDAMARPLIEAIDKAEEGLDLSSLFVIGSAGAVLSEAVKEQIRARLGSVMIIDSFGASETGHQGSMVAGTGHGAEKGPLFEMNDSNCVFDDDLKPLEPGSGVIGKLARRGHIPVGYYNDPEKTAATFVEIAGERWAMPGDMATIEADGTIRVFGRGTVSINSGGEKIFPEEVEAALKAHADVLDAIVVGVPDERWGQRVAALVQMRPGRELDKADIEAHCRHKVAGYKAPREIHEVEKVMRQPSGKPDYRWAKSYATEASGGAREPASKGR